MKTLKCCLLALLLACAAGCAPDSNHTAPAQVSERAKRERARLVELASKHHASVDWMLSFLDRGMGRVFTADLEGLSFPQTASLSG